jgi:adenylosuccinate synthase
MITNTTLIGMQFGDEGKGKVLDVLAPDFDIVVRYQGGANAGHTVIAEGKKYVFHIIPSGVLYPKKTCVVGNGTVIDVLQLKKEIEELQEQGIDVCGLKISNHAHIVMPYHKLLDEAREEFGTRKIGTTKRGIGPCYADKVARVGIRVEDLYNPEKFSDLLDKNLTEKNAVLQGYGKDPLWRPEISKTYLEAASFLKPYVTDTQKLLQQAYRANKRILFEGAQGIMLDIDHGTYPYVTSSSTGPANAANGSGVTPHATGRILGIAKAYTTRVGEGPFPTELHNGIGETLQSNGNEYGATTGRPRRCGWLDLVQLKYAVELTGAADIVLTKLDVLADMPELKVAVKYSGDGWHNADPQYITFKGFSSLAGIETWEALPLNAKQYINYIEDFLGVRILYVSVGPERNALITNPNW